MKKKSVSGVLLLFFTAHSAHCLRHCQLMLFPALADLKITESAPAVLLPAWAHLSAINEEGSVHTVDL